MTYLSMIAQLAILSDDNLLHCFLEIDIIIKSIYLPIIGKYMDF